MRLFDDARNKMGLSSYVHGTGFVTRMELIKDGWETVTITEDGEFSCIQKSAGGAESSMWTRPNTMTSSQPG